MLSESFILSRDGDRECIEALAYLSRAGSPYSVGGFTPPLRARLSPPKERKYIGIYLRLGRKTLRGAGARVTRIEWAQDTTTETAQGTPEQIAESMARRLLTARTAGAYLVTTGIKRRSLDVWLDSIGAPLLGLGYQIQPCATQEGVIFAKIKKGKRTWTLVYLESMTGVSINTGLAFAESTAEGTSNSTMGAQRVYSAVVRLGAFLSNHFGSALHLTAGMTAMDCVRRSLPIEFQKWRPSPLLVQMERIAKGYRAGLTYATRYRGPTWRVDVNRQYTHALRTRLPLQAGFGRYIDEKVTPHGVFMCRVQLSGTLPYPLGVWGGPESGFRLSKVGRGSYVCVLHTSEFPGLRAAGATIAPEWGYVFSRTFSLESYVERIQAVINTYGKDSPEGRLTKPLGNYVYGKFAQAPSRWELLYSIDNPGKEWFPHWDDLGEPHEQVWERKVTRHTASQHVDIGAAITGAARSQTLSTWAYLSALGATIVRCHTDSLTLDLDPQSMLNVSDSEIGSWRVDQRSDDSIIIGANAYVDSEGAHIAGVSEPTPEMIERIYDGQIVSVTQNVRTPRRGFTSGGASVTRAYKPSG